VKLKLVTYLDHPFFIEDTPGLDFDDEGTQLKRDMVEIVKEGLQDVDLGRLP